MRIIQRNKIPCLDFHVFNGVHNRHSDFFIGTAIHCLICTKNYSGIYTFSSKIFNSDSKYRRAIAEAFIKHCLGRVVFI